MAFKLVKCKLSGVEWKKYNSLQKCRCEKCIKNITKSTLKKQTTIRKVSVKQDKLNKIYSKLRIEFLSLPENQICPITKQQTTDVHHKKGRKGFADDWARENNIPLIIDVRFFLAVSREGHDKIENNPEWAYENGFSIRRNKI